MKFIKIERKINHLAIAGFLLPFASCGIVGALILWAREDISSLRFLLSYFSLVPGVLGGGLFCSIRSIGLIEEQNDKDYAYSGLTLNIVFLLIYFVSIIYFLGG